MQLSPIHFLKNDVFKEDTMTVCPSCKTEMISRNGIHVCPRNEIGDCAFDAYTELKQGYYLKPKLQNIPDQWAIRQPSRPHM